MNKKVGLSKLEWILSIFGIILLVLLIVLPPVFRVVFEEENPVDTKPKPEEKDNQIKKEAEIDDSAYNKVTCIKQVPNASYVEVSSIILSTDNGLLKVYTESMVNTYYLNSKDSDSLYTEAKLECTNVSDSFYQVKGLNYSCSSSEDSVSFTKKYDLARFTPTTVTNKVNNSISFNSSYVLDQNVEEIKNLLVTDGYTCQ